MRIAASPDVIPGSLYFVRAGRAFDEVEVALIAELISKAELSAAEIIAHHAIYEQAMTDSLTGLGNRRKLSADLDNAFDHRARGGSSLLLLFDLNGFKDYNDTFGHLAGDALLARLGSKLQRAVDGCGMAYRLGGDEFCAHVNLAGLEPGLVIQRASAALTETGAGFTVQASLGVVLLPHEADSAEHALQIADNRMYANKPSRPTAARRQAREVLLRTMSAKQPELNDHAGNVADLAVRVGHELGLEGEALDDVTQAAQLHDIGKVGVPDAILNKSGRLSESDWAFVRTHTILGERILHGAPALRTVARFVRASHERWDGSGYPDRLCATEIPLGARIISVCDAYEAMTTDRPYRAAVTHETACQELRRCSGRQFDPAVVDAFITVVDSSDENGALYAAQHPVVHVRALLGLGVAQPIAD
jgi:diguanylate cyclase (GGDEF)-like protein